MESNRPASCSPLNGSQTGGSDSGTEKALRTCSSLHGSEDGRAPHGKTRPKLREWNAFELKVLIAAKRHEQETMELAGTTQAKISLLKNKWEKIASVVLSDGVNNPTRDSGSCKKRWSSLCRDFRRVFDYEKQPVSSGKSYYRLTTAERKERSLPVNFPEEFYKQMEDWFPKIYDTNLQGSPSSADPIGQHPIDQHLLEADSRRSGDNTSNLGDNAMDLDEHESGVTPPIVTTSTQPGAPDSGDKGKRKRNIGGVTGDVSKAMSDAVMKMIDALKEDCVRRSLHNEAFMEWEKQHKLDQLALLNEQTRIQRDQMEHRARVEELQAQSFHVLAQALAKLVDKDEVD